MDMGMGTVMGMILMIRIRKQNNYKKNDFFEKNKIM
jgi:hypothetical protein